MAILLLLSILSAVVSGTEPCAYLTDLEVVDQIRPTANFGGRTTMAMGDGKIYDKFLIIFPTRPNDPNAFTTFALNGEYARFTAVVGPAQSNADTGFESYTYAGTFSVEISVDGEPPAYYRNGFGRTGFEIVDIDVTGKREIKIETHAGGSSHGDYPTIADPVLSCHPRLRHFWRFASEPYILSFRNFQIPGYIPPLQDMVNPEIINPDNAQYTMQLVGDASADRNGLNCNNGYATTVGSIPNYGTVSHTLVASFVIDDYNVRGGAPIAIDGGWVGGDHNGFDAIVYNELGRKEWIAGSEWHRRTDLAPVGSPEIENNDEITMTMVMSYDVEAGSVTSYRNGVVYDQFPPSGFMGIDGDDTKVLACIRHVGAGVQSFGGKIKFVAFFEGAMTAEEAEAISSGVIVPGVPSNNPLYSMIKNHWTTIFGFLFVFTFALVAINISCICCCKRNKMKYNIVKTIDSESEFYSDKI